jgi:hypothetical protein
MKSDAEAAESFARYLKHWIKKNARDVEDRASKKGGQVSNSKVTSAINGMYADHRMRILEAIAIGIGRPPEEVFLAALGYHPPLTEDPDFTESEAAHLWRRIKELPLSERKFYNRNLRMLSDEIQKREDVKD